jgi:ATP adenylyltransferase
MDRLWTPWRYRYVSSAKPTGADSKGCIFCEKAASSDDRGNYIVLRAERNFLILNLYPYTTGHLMIVPYEHLATLEGAPQETLQ